ncbi:hypothetical protein AZF37_08290 [endosymbiont 'TC1' of Trimyema compressum]|uniref:CPBP family intramembrane glutamic endopeptidase n=1 Tax=endosymbiont 'TC1' of Trimyema compressum TaxID=243899 RepID=UPI0007F110F5|nr:CPBP family intramembrane glutamic endopeptidase [endosymbiont 'TC1' of Trimyema compressum]AMP21154.1 hypothetical protein AZF37_08290 [endosymbiont 'TC1' of Trimyema compressum]
MKKGFSFWSAAIISALLFGLIHLNLLQGMVGFCLGLVLAYLVYKTKSIWIPFIFHGVYNSTIVILGYALGGTVSEITNYLFLGFGLPIFVVSLIVFIIRKIKEGQKNLRRSI